MKLNENDKPHKELNQSFPLVTAKQNCTNFNFLLDYLKNYQHQLKSIVSISYGMLTVYFLITFVQICLEKLIPNNPKYRLFDLAFEDGSDLSFWDVYHIIFNL